MDGLTDEVISRFTGLSFQVVGEVRETVRVEGLEAEVNRLRKQVEKLTLELETAKIMAHEDPKEQFNRGVDYYKGRGVDQDYEKAFKLFRKAADQNNADAQLNVGVMYFKGQGVGQDYQKTLEWYEKAADQNCAKAQFYLGGMYFKGQGVDQDYRREF